MKNEAVAVINELGSSTSFLFPFFFCRVYSLIRAFLCSTLQNKGEKALVVRSVRLSINELEDLFVCRTEIIQVTPKIEEEQRANDKTCVCYAYTAPFSKQALVRLTLIIGLVFQITPEGARIRALDEFNNDTHKFL